MYTVYLFVVAVLGALLTILIRKHKGVAVWESLLNWLLFVCIGFGGVWAFMGHAFFPKQVAASIGWPTSPFQWEIAMANLAVGVLALLSPIFKGRFRLASAIAATVYLLGCAAGHIKQIVIAGNHAANNAGPLLWVGDLTVPLLVLVLAILIEIKQRKEHPAPIVKL